MKNISLFIVTFALIAGAIAYLYTGSNDTAPQKPVPDESALLEKPVTQIQNSNIQQARKTPNLAQPETAAEAVEVELAEEELILGQFLRVRAVREKQDESEYDTVRNLEFVFRPGILPKRLFENNNNVITRYDQLYKNDVGAGAVTTLFYYEVVTADTNGDGVLSDGDEVDIAVSNPDGSDYTTLVSNVDKVFVYEQLPAENALRLELQLDDRIVRQTYSLETKTLIYEEQVQSVK